MAFLFLPTVHNYIYRQTQAAAAASLHAQARNGGRSPVVESVCTTVADIVVMCSNCSLFFHLACLVYWGHALPLGRQAVNVWACCVFLSHYLKDLLLIPKITKVEPSLRAVCNSKRLKRAFADSRTTWDLPCEPMCTLAAMLSMCAVLAACVYPGYTVWVFFNALLVFACASGSFAYLGLYSSPCLYTSAVLGGGVACLWVHYGDALEDTIFLWGSSAIVNLLLTLACAFFLLLGYPIPFKYSYSFPRVARALATATGFIVGGNSYALLANHPGGGTNDCYGSVLRNLKVGLSQLRRQGLLGLSGHALTVSQECMYDSGKRAMGGVVVALILRLLVSRFVHFQVSRRLLFYSPFFRPRLSANAASVLEGCDHRFLQTVEKAREDLYDARRLRRQFELERQTMIRKSGSKLGNRKEKRKKMEVAEGLIYEYAVPTNIAQGVLEGLVCSCVVPFSLDLLLNHN